MSALPVELALLDTYSVSGLRVLEKLFTLGRDIVARDIRGDLVECGVCNGGSAAAIACAFRETKRSLWLYDSFEGLPPAKEIDGTLASNYVGTFIGHESKVNEAIKIAQFPLQNCIIRKGWFEDTFEAPLPESVALLHIDADWYDSVMKCLDAFYDRVTEGGIIVLDDYGHWEGCREAFYDFTRVRRLKPLLERFGHSQAFWIKGREHNREFSGRWEIP